jgi:hypothetical protein
MPLPAHFAGPKPLGDIIDHLREMPWSGWLYVRNATRDIDLAVECFPSDFDSQQASEEEAEEFEASVAAAGFKPFFCREQLEGILENLRLQRRNHGRAEIAKAIDYYWKRDAFIVLDGDVA